MHNTCFFHIEPGWDQVLNREDTDNQITEKLFGAESKKWDYRTEWIAISQVTESYKLPGKSL